MHFSQILDDCPLSPGHDMDNFTEGEDLIDMFITFYASNDNQLKLKDTHGRTPHHHLCDGGIKEIC